MTSLSDSSSDDDMPPARPGQKFKRRRNAAPDTDDLRFARGIWRRQDRQNERGRSLSEEGRMFNEWFGCDVLVALALWASLLEKTGNTTVCGEMHHMLWALAFMKGHAKEHVTATMFGADKDIVSKWVWLFMDAMANLEPDTVSL